MESRDDRLSVTFANGAVSVILRRPSDPTVAQTAIHRALSAGCIAAGVRPVRVVLEAQQDGAVQGEVVCSYYGWSADPQLSVSLEIVAAVARSALEAMGFHGDD